MDIGSTFITDPQAAVLAEPGDGALHDPAIDPQATAVRGATPGQPGRNPPVTQRAPMGLRVIGSVPQDRLGRPRRRPTLPARGGMASTRGSNCVTSWRLAGVIVTARGIPLAEVRT